MPSSTTRNQSKTKCNASCSRGWLKLVVQCIFGTLTVLSFSYIVVMSIHSAKKEIIQSDRCIINNCKVFCNDTPLNGERESDIISTVLEAAIKCNVINLELHNPTFKNRMLPRNWLAGMRTPIYELSIMGGNLEYIESEAFMSQFTEQTNTLVFRHIVVDGWKPDTFVGFSNLKSLYVKDSIIKHIEPNALKPIDESLRKLTITSSGLWKPEHILKGSYILELSTVDFSFNKFSNVLGKQSFKNLGYCKILYLNSCEIEAVKDGTFDYLKSVEVIYLNHNYLQYIQPTLFSKVLETAPDLRVMLHNNHWHCDCSLNETDNMVQQEAFLLDPICYYPENIRGKSFMEFKKICEKRIDNNMPTEIIDDCDPAFSLGGCCRSPENNSLKIITPMKKYQCTYNTMRNLDAKIFDQNPAVTDSRWFRPLLFVKSLQFMMVQAETIDKNGLGLIWHKSSCPNEIYCINIFPNFMKMSNLNLTSDFKFCPLQLSTGKVEVDECFEHHTYIKDILYPASSESNKLSLVLYILASGILCLVLGALFIYAIIFKNPSLLKGNKRVLFVKHKSLDVLVLPPKLPPRNDLKDKLLPEFNDKDIFVIPDKKHNLCVAEFSRSISTRSSKSNAPSYISAVQPTSDQLAEWRLKHHFDNPISIRSNKSDSSLYSTDFDSSYYSSTTTCDIFYEPLI